MFKPIQPTQIENDQETQDVDRVLYGLAELAIEEWLKTKGSKNPVGVLPDEEVNGKIEV